MPSSAQGANVYLGRGKIFFDRFDTAGASTGLRFVGTASQVNISQSPEVLELQDFSQASAPTLKRVVTKDPIEISIKLHEFVKENVALALLGVEATYTQAGTAVTGESLGAVKKDRIYKLANRQVSSVVVKKGVTTLVAGTDYDVLDAAVGLIYIRPGSVTVVDGDTLTADYSRAAITAMDKVQGGQQPLIEGRLLYVGDPAAGPSWDYDFWKVQISPDGDLALIGTDYGELNLKGLVISDPVGHPTEPNFVAIRKA